MNFKSEADCNRVARTFANLGVAFLTHANQALRPHSSQAALSSSQNGPPSSQAGPRLSLAPLSSSAPYQPRSGSQEHKGDVFGRVATPSLSRQPSVDRATPSDLPLGRQHEFARPGPRPGPISDVFGIRSGPVQSSVMPPVSSSPPLYPQSTLFSRVNDRPVSAPEDTFERLNMDTPSQSYSLSQMLPPVRKLPFPEPRSRMGSIIQNAEMDSAESMMTCDRCRIQDWTCSGNSKQVCDNCEKYGLKCTYPALIGNETPKGQEWVISNVRDRDSKLTNFQWIEESS